MGVTMATMAMATMETMATLATMETMVTMATMATMETTETMETTTTETPIPAEVEPTTSPSVPFSADQDLKPVPRAQKPVLRQPTPRLAQRSTLVAKFSKNSKLIVCAVQHT